MKSLNRSYPSAAPSYSLMRAASAALIFACAIGSAAAGNLSFLNETPISYMKSEDYRSIQIAVEEALSGKRDGESATWTNDGTNNTVRITATITPTKTEMRGDLTCRETRIVLGAAGQTLIMHPPFCRNSTGAWDLMKY